MTKHPTVAAIDAALSKALAEGWETIEIAVTWPMYRDLLALKGSDWTPSEFKRDAKHADRPIKEYRGYPLILQDVNDVVRTRLADGSSRGWAIYQPG